MQLLRFAAGVIDALGGAAEVDADLADALLPEALSRRLGLPGELRLVEGPRSVQGAVGLFHGSELLDGLVEAALGSGRTAALRADLAVPGAGGASLPPAPEEPYIVTASSIAA